MQSTDRLAAARAAFVAAHVVFLSLMALPAPAVSEEDLARPEVQGWFDDTAARLGRFGVELDGAALRELAVPWGRRWLAARSVVLAPGDLYARVCGVHQSWRMFAGVSPEAARLRLDAREADVWRPVYLPRSREAAWRVRFFEHERVRTMVSQFAHERHRSDYRRLGRWLALRAPDELGDVDALRLTMDKTRTPEPEELVERGSLADDGTFWSTVVPVRVRP